jgi:hypothetical protein
MDNTLGNEKIIVICKQKQVKEKQKLKKRQPKLPFLRAYLS